MAPHVMVEPICIESIARIKASYPGNGLRDRLARYHTHVDDAFLGWADIWLDPAFRDWQLFDEASRLTCPTLLVQGRDDEYGTLAQLDAIGRRARGPVSRLVLDRCGHSPHRDRAGEVIDAISTFIAQLINA